MALIFVVVVGDKVFGPVDDGDDQVDALPILGRHVSVAEDGLVVEIGPRAAEIVCRQRGALEQDFVVGARAGVPEVRRRLCGPRTECGGAAEEEVPPPVEVRGRVEEAVDAGDMIR